MCGNFNPFSGNSLKKCGPADGYIVTEVVTNPTIVLLKGNKTLLNSINEIQIPEELLSIEGATKDLTGAVDVSEFIPEGVELVNSEQATVGIAITVAKVKTRTFSINTQDIIVTGLPTHTTLEYELSSVAVNVTGLETDVNALTPEMLAASMDVTELGIGRHEVELKLDLDETKFTLKPVMVVVTVVEETEEPVIDSETSE